MKYFISHRGNINGRIPEKENNPEYIIKAIDEGYDVEIDVWKINSKLFLGHDEPQYEITIDFLFNTKLWCHAKNFAALTMMVNHKDKIHFFSHNLDSHVLSSKGFIMSNIGEEIDENTICIMPEKTKIYNKKDFEKCAGICSDEIQRYKILNNI